MKAAVPKWLTAAIIVIAVVLGCNIAFDPAADEETNGNTDFAHVEGGFSDAPVSPGGTGGIGAEDLIGQEDIDLVAEETRSFFTAFQIDPEAEDTAGPKFVIAADIDQDGLLDLVSAWNQSQPVQLHLQRRDDDGNISFRTISLGGTDPIAIVAGLEVGQINDDGWLDVVVLSKATGHVTLCPTNPPKEISMLEGEIVVLFSPGRADLLTDGDRWTEMILVNPLIADVWIHNQFPGIEYEDFEVGKTKPEWNGFAALVVANIDGVSGDDIIVALNPGECEELGQKPPIGTVDLWVNPGPGLAEISEQWGAPPPLGVSRGVPVSIMLDAPQVKDLAVMDVDSDGDLDVIATWTNAISQNTNWARNPLVAHEPGGPDGLEAVIAGVSDGWRFIATGWQERPIGQIDTGSDIIDIGDIDGDGFDDVVVRSTYGQIVQWFRRPNTLTIQPEFPPNDTVPDRFNFPWPVFTLTEFSDQEPEAIALGDITGNGRLELMVAVQGGVFWYDSTIGGSVFDAWAPNTIIQDSSADNSAAGTVQAGGDIPGSGVGVEAVDTSTHINALLVVDLDDDGKNDIVGTLDRRSGAGLSDDRIVWYRNVRPDD